jgi:hypothetical protein
MAALRGARELLVACRGRAGLRRCREQVLAPPWRVLSRLAAAAKDAETYFEMPSPEQVRCPTLI